MSLSDDAFRIDKHGGTHVIRFMHGISDRLGVDRMNIQVQNLLKETGPPQFVVDFSQVKQMSSSILGVLMGLHLKVCRRDGELRLCGINRELMEVFHLMKLDTILAIDQTVNESLARMS